MKRGYNGSCSRKRDLLKKQKKRNKLKIKKKLNYKNIGKFVQQSVSRVYYMSQGFRKDNEDIGSTKSSDIGIHFTDIQWG